MRPQVAIRGEKTCMPGGGVIPRSIDGFLIRQSDTVRLAETYCWLLGALFSAARHGDGAIVDSPGGLAK
jgi:hypothetical protein